ncbi:DnaD domain-containing protein [Lapidilactobacillus mulanensis]|uniref:DnaD domain-containing protein n=1 Tax=Lapidilactobacillus mulanensis TaxID=2485999 RepID=A0ABW4DPD4_9LACO|nr:DnaD domain protein [Lapidilactobacillus mulanensis]
MAIYRQIHTTIWKDDWIGGLSLADKSLWLYLLTNDRTTQCGVYDFSWRYATFETGISQESLKTALQKFQDDGKVVFNPKTNEIMIVNWLKYNSARSPKVAPVIDKELKEVKTLEFESEVIRKCLSYQYPIRTKEPKKNTVSIGYQYGIDTVLQPEPSPTSSPEPSTASTAEPEKDAPADVLAELSQFYQQNFGVINPTIAQELEYSLADFDGNAEMLKEAMRRAALDQKGFRYAQGIMKNWKTANVKTLDQVKAEDVSHENSVRNKRPQKKTGVTPSWFKDVVQPENKPDDTQKTTPEQKASIAEKLAALKQANEQKAKTT